MTPDEMEALIEAHLRAAGNGFWGTRREVQLSRCSHLANRGRGARTAHHRGAGNARG
jgi:hypothetical protein